MRVKRFVLACAVVAAAVTGVVLTAAQSPAASAATGIPHLDHVFLIMEENNGYGDVIGNPAAPNLNYLAKTFGVATDYFGASPDSSESNYVAILGGSTFGVSSDDAYWKNKVDAPSLISQLDKEGISWKG
jgi:phospholipase C